MQLLYVVFCGNIRQNIKLYNSRISPLVKFHNLITWSTRGWKSSTWSALSPSTRYRFGLPLFWALPDLITNVNSFDDFNQKLHFVLLKRLRIVLKLFTNYILGHQRTWSRLITKNSIRVIYVSPFFVSMGLGLATVTYIIDSINGNLVI